MSENNSLASVNPRDVVVAKPEEINQLTQEVVEMERIARDTTRELQELDDALTSFSNTHQVYRNKAADVRRKMNTIAKDL